MQTRLVKEEDIKEEDESVEESTFKQKKPQKLSKQKSKNEKVDQNCIEKPAESVFDCLKCEYTSNKKQEVRRHTRIKHDGVEYKCKQIKFC